MRLADLKPQQRVQIHPATDLWMRGDRYGVIVSVGRSHVQVYMDRSKRTVRLHPVSIYEVV